MKKLLLIDDKVLVLRSTSRMLERLGFQVTTAGTFADAAALLAAGGFDVIVSDYRLEGLRTADELFPHAPAVPLVICSGTAELVSERVRSFALAVVEKPFDWKQLPAMLEK